MRWPFSSNTTVNNSTRGTCSLPPYDPRSTPVPSYQPPEPNAADGVVCIPCNASSDSASSVSFPNSEVLSDYTSFADTASTGGTFGAGTRPSGPRYSELESFRYRCLFNHQIAPVYYRLFVEDGPILTANPVYANDPYLGRIPADIVAPPHTAKDIKLCLSDVEHIRDNTSTSLFISTSGQTPIDDGRRVSISAYPGPGCAPHEPIALVVKCTGSGRRTLQGATADAGRLSPAEGPTPFETQYRKCIEALPRFPITPINCSSLLPGL